jgi:hypothetical protein
LPRRDAEIRHARQSSVALLNWSINYSIYGRAVPK